MKQITLTEQEANIVITLLKRVDVPVNLQKFVYELVDRIEKELET